MSCLARALIRLNNAARPPPARRSSACFALSNYHHFVLLRSCCQGCLDWDFDLDLDANGAGPLRSVSASFLFRHNVDAPRCSGRLDWAPAGCGLRPRGPPPNGPHPVPNPDRPDPSRGQGTLPVACSASALCARPTFYVRTPPSLVPLLAPWVCYLAAGAAVCSAPWCYHQLEAPHDLGLCFVREPSVCSAGSPTRRDLGAVNAGFARSHAWPCACGAPICCALAHAGMDAHTALGFTGTDSYRPRIQPVLCFIFRESCAAIEQASHHDAYRALGP